MTLIKKILDHAKSVPDAPAIGSIEGETISYSDLADLIVSVDRQLQTAAINHQDVLALVVENGPVAATAFLALSAFAPCAPLNPGFSQADFKFYLDDLEPQALVVLAGSETTAKAAAIDAGIPVIEINARGDVGDFNLSSDSISVQVNAQPKDSVYSPAGLGQRALVLHTSGTTSRPKLVPLTHGNLSASAENVSETLQLSPSDRCLNIMPLFHIHGLVAALLASLHSGGCVYCSPGLDSDHFLQNWLPQLLPTWYTAVPTMHQALLRTASRSTQDCSSLRFIRSSSASLPPTTMRELEDQFGAPVIEAYGMTEAAHQMASNPLPPSERRAGAVGLAGGPEVAVMDEKTDQFLGANEVGEVVIRGDNVTSGYLNNPEANDNAFVDGWFRTGDQGRVDNAGYLWLTGRLKEIINRGGEKVSPREIDEATLKIPGVRQAVAFAINHKSLGEDIALALVSDKDAELTESSVRAALFTQLAAYKVPSQVIFVEAIPKGATGKLQRIGLAEKLADQLQEPYEPPRHPFDSMLVDELASVLDMRSETIGIHSNFFALGGDSLSGTKFMHRISDIFEIQVAAVELFRHPTIFELHQQLRTILISHGAENVELVNALETYTQEDLDSFGTSDTNV